MRVRFCGCCAGAVCGCHAPGGFEDRTVVSGLSGPTMVSWAPDGRMFIAEKAGRVKVRNTSGSVETVLDISDHVYGIADRGLIGLAVDSSFASNRYLWLLYVYNPPGASGNGARTSRLTRVTVNPDNTASGETVVLGSIGTPPCPTPSNTVDCIPADEDSHAIGAVRSAPDGTLWITNGDGAAWTRMDPLALRVYDEQSMAGKVLHVDRTGRGLSGHPFCPSETDLTKVCTKIYAKGIRNMFRFTLRSGGLGPAGGDVGWQTWEEVNLIGAGKNYGWPCYEGFTRTPSYRDLPECALQYANEGGPNAATPPLYVYNHNESTSYSSAVVAGPFYNGGPYPDEFDGDWFIGDYAAGWIKRLEFDGAGNVSARRDFATDWYGVSIEMGPGNELYYTDFGDGSNGSGAVKRIVYTGASNAVPVARADATPRNGPLPLQVSFSAAASSDGNGDALSYEWDFGDGSGSTQRDPVHTFTAPVNRDVRLTVRDGRGGEDTIQVRVHPGNTPPVARINAPADGGFYNVGDPIQLDGGASDAQDGALAGSALSWHVTLVHISHNHDLGTFTGARPTFAAPSDHDADSYFVIDLTATDSRGQTDAKRVTVYPRAIDLTLASNPPGAPVTYAGTAAPAPRTIRAAQGFAGSISAAESFQYGGTAYDFAGWSDGGARAHNITVPRSNATLTANYTAAPIVFEGEAMTLTPAGGVAVRAITDSSASGGNTAAFRTSPSAATRQYTTAGRTDQVTLRMRGDSCQGSPQAAVTIDSFSAGTVNVSSGGYTDYKLALTDFDGGAAGTHTIKVEFLNDFRSSGCDRGLYLDKVTIRHAIGPPPIAIPDPPLPGSGNPAAAPDRAPHVRLTGSRTQRLLRRKDVPVTVQVDEAATIVARGALSLPGASAVVRTKEKRIRLSANSKKTLQLGFSRKGLSTVRKALRKHRRLTMTLTVTATDGAGNRRTAKTKLALRT